MALDVRDARLTDLIDPSGSRRTDSNRMPIHRGTPLARHRAVSAF